MNPNYDWHSYKKGKFGHFRIGLSYREKIVKMKGKMCDAFTSQAMPKIASKPPEGGWEAWSRFSLRTLRRKQLCGHLDLELLASRSCKSLYHVVLSYRSPRKWIQDINRKAKGTELGKVKKKVKLILRISESFIFSKSLKYKLIFFILNYFTINIYSGRDLANETVTDIQMFQRFLNAFLQFISWF